MLTTCIIDSLGAQYEAGQQTRHDTPPNSIMSRNRIDSIQSDRGSILVNEPHYAKPTFSSLGRAGLPRPLGTRTFSSTSSSLPGRNTSQPGGWPRQTQDRRHRRSSDGTTGLSLGADTEVEPGTPTPGISVHGTENDDEPQPPTEEGKEPIQELRPTNPDSDLEEVIQAPTPGTTTAINNPPNGTCTEPEETPKKEVVTTPDPAFKPALPVKIDGKPIQGPTDDEKPSGQPGPDPKPTSRNNNDRSRLFAAKESQRRYPSERPAKEGEKAVEHVMGLLVEKRLQTSRPTKLTATEDARVR